MELKFFKTGIKIEFQICENDEEVHFLQEYLNLNSSAILSKWKKLAQKTDFSEGEQLLFELILSLKQDISKLEANFKASNELIDLENKNVICGINFEHIEFLDDVLEENKQYYARFEISERKIALFIRALNSKMAEIIKIKNEDKIVFDAFVMQTQRDIIRDLKGNNNG